MVKKRHIAIIGIILIILSASEAQAAKDIITTMNEVYTQVKDYSTPEINIGDKTIELLSGNESIGTLIKNRCIVMMAIALIIYIASKVIPVLINPNQQLEKNFWVKPVLLALFLSTYNTSMGIVDNLVRYISFESYRKEMRSSKQTLQNQINMIGDETAEIDTYLRQEIDDELSGVTPTQAAVYNIGGIEELVNEEAERMTIEEKIATGVATKEEKKQQQQYITEQQENSIGAKIATQVTLWLGDKIMIVMIVIQTIILSVLFLGGPIAIVMEIVPIFQGTLSKWFGMYIYVHMMTPIFYIIDSVSIKLHEVVGGTGAGTFLLIIFQLVMISMYIMAGKIAGYFIQIKGSSGEGSIQSLARGAGGVGRAARGAIRK